MKKFTAYFCALACAASLLMPAANISTAETVSAKTVSIMSTTTGGEITIPVISDTNDTSYETYQGTIGESSTITYTFHLSKPIYFIGNTAASLASGSIYYEISDAAGTLYCNASNSSSYPTGQFSKKYLPTGDYQLTVRSSANTSGEYVIQAFGYDASTSGTIKEKTIYTGYNNSEVWKKIKITKNGCLAVGAQMFSFNSSGETSTYGNNVTLYNSKKKAISNSNYTSSSNEYMTYYGVKKGTYYIKISGKGLYNITAHVAKKAAIPATTKAKAKKVTSSTKYYVMPASTKKSSAWFKFTISKPKKVTLTTSYIGDYSLDVKIYKGSKSVDSFKLYNNDKKGRYYSNFLTGKEVTWPKGVYYVKVTKTKTDSGIVGVNIK